MRWPSSLTSSLARPRSIPPKYRRESEGQRGVSQKSPSLSTVATQSLTEFEGLEELAGCVFTRDVLGKPRRQGRLDADTDVMLSAIRSPGRIPSLAGRRAACRPSRKSKRPDFPDFRSRYLLAFSAAAALAGIQYSVTLGTRCQRPRRTRDAPSAPRSSKSLSEIRRGAP